MGRFVSNDIVWWRQSHGSKSTVECSSEKRKRQTNWLNSILQAFRLENKIRSVERDRKAAEKKAKRDDAIHNTPVIRTYDYKKGTVKDHRTGKIASLKQVVQKGRIDLLKDKEIK